MEMLQIATLSRAAICRPSSLANKRLQNKRRCVQSVKQDWLVWKGKIRGHIGVLGRFLDRALGSECRANQRRGEGAVNRNIGGVLGQTSTRAANNRCTDLFG
jgi:hypothetical protein